MTALSALASALISLLGAAPASRWDARLVALEPADPMGYFELAEEVADAASGEPELSLARRLYLLAWETAAQTDAASSPDALPAGVCLALADLSRDSSERRWLLAVAAATNPSITGQDLVRPAGLPPADSSEFAVAEALGLFRAGEYRKARAALEPRERQELLTDSGIFPDGKGRKLLREAQSTPLCAECRNRRVVRASADPDARWLPCNLCGANPGPRLNVGEALDHFRAESLLLNMPIDSWTAQSIVDPSPARPLDRREVARSLGVDPDATIYRDGRWLAPGLAEPAPPTSPGAS